MSESASLKQVYEATTLLAATTATATAGTTGSAVRIPAAAAYAFTVDVTAAAVGADDTLDVYVQTIIDGTNWIDVVHFTQVLGNGGAKRYTAKVCAGSTQDDFEHGTALSAGEVRHLCGDAWRVKYVIVDGGAATAESFTFSLVGLPM